MSTATKIEVGDWVRFGDNGKLKIGRVEYLVTEKIGFKDVPFAVTDAGKIFVDSILEVRKP